MVNYLVDIERKILSNKFQYNGHERDVCMVIILKIDRGCILPCKLYIDHLDEFDRLELSEEY